MGGAHPTPAREFSFLCNASISFPGYYSRIEVGVDGMRRMGLGAGTGTNFGPVVNSARMK